LNVKELKDSIRRRIWSLMEAQGIADFPRPVYGRIPNFIGSERAAERILGLREWVRAEVILANPDSPQLHLRRAALLQGKQVVMATPRLLNGFIIIDPRRIPERMLVQAATIKGAFKYGRRIGLREMPSIDLVVTGCVAVDLEGGRLGKGGGYGDLEYAILREIDAVSSETPIVTTVHDIQIVDKVPMEIHDYSVDYIATPTRLIKSAGSKARPSGVYWEILGDKAGLGILLELRIIIEEKKRHGCTHGSSHGLH